MQETVWRALFDEYPSVHDRIRLHEASLFLFDRPLILERQARMQKHLESKEGDLMPASPTTIGHVTRSIIADFDSFLEEGGRI